MLREVQQKTLCVSVNVAEQVLGSTRKHLTIFSKIVLPHYYLSIHSCTSSFHLHNTGFVTV